MIARIWQGRTRPGIGKDDYGPCLDARGRRSDRICAGHFVGRHRGHPGFSCPEPERAVYYPADDRYFAESERTPFVGHFAVRESV